MVRARKVGQKGMGTIQVEEQAVKGTKMVSERSVLRVYRARRGRKDDGVAWAGGS